MTEVSSEFKAIQTHHTICNAKIHGLLTVSRYFIDLYVIRSFFLKYVLVTKESSSTVVDSELSAVPKLFLLLMCTWDWVVNIATF